MDRDDELMLALYQGFVPQWLPEPSRRLFERESLRRRCDLGQALLANYGRTVFCARCLISENFSEQVYAGWPATRFQATNVTTGLYLALDGLLRDIEGVDALRELLHYEALAVTNLRCAPGAQRVAPTDAPGTSVGEAELYRFRYAVPELHTRMTLYAGSLAPASFVRSYEATERTTWVARNRTARGWVVRDVTAHFNGEIDEVQDATSDLS